MDLGLEVAGYEPVEQGVVDGFGFGVGELEGDAVVGVAGFVLVLDGQGGVFELDGFGEEGEVDGGGFGGSEVGLLHEEEGGLLPTNLTN